ncbi:MAG TPA: hypothetical protein VHG35_12235, partial [Gemmatimonadales bacterium]|nr:hypothetical protein [Gemmatimonadales bacterium]
MNWSHAERIADAVLYEGYLLYPYRPAALKNRRRWTFGVLCPPAFCRRASTGDRSDSRTECLVEGDGATSLAARVRFLQLLEPSAAEREITLDELSLERLSERPEERSFRFPPLEGVVRMDAIAVEDGLYRLRLSVANLTPFAAGEREDAMASSLLSCHSVLGARGGRFVSLTDPPQAWVVHAERCENVGTWPVLVGDQERSLLLSSPIILPDFPQVAPESPGD